MGISRISANRPELAAVCAGILSLQPADGIAGTVGIAAVLDRIEAQQQERLLPEGITALPLLQMAYRGQVQLTQQQMRAAIEALPFEVPKLSAAAITTMDEKFICCCAGPCNRTQAGSATIKRAYYDGASSDLERVKETLSEELSNVLNHPMIMAMNVGGTTQSTIMPQMCLLALLPRHQRQPISEISSSPKAIHSAVPMPSSWGKGRPAI